MNFIFITWMVIQCTGLQKCYPNAYELMFWVGFFFYNLFTMAPARKKNTATAN